MQARTPRSTPPEQEARTEAGRRAGWQEGVVLFVPGKHTDPGGKKSGMLRGARWSTNTHAFFHVRGNVNRG